MSAAYYPNTPFIIVAITKSFSFSRGQCNTLNKMLAIYKHEVCHWFSIFTLKNSLYLSVDLYVCVCCLSLCVCAHKCWCLCRGQRHWDPLDLELQVIVSHMILGVNSDLLQEQLSHPSIPCYGNLIMSTNNMVILNTCMVFIWKHSMFS